MSFGHFFWSYMVILLTPLSKKGCLSPQILLACQRLITGVQKILYLVERFPRAKFCIYLSELDRKTWRWIFQRFHLMLCPNLENSKIIICLKRRCLNKLLLLTKLSEESCVFDSTRKPPMGFFIPHLLIIQVPDLSLWGLTPSQKFPSASLD